MNKLETQNAPRLSHHGASRNNNSDPIIIAQLTQINQELAPHNVKETIAWLLRLERPPLPENPIEAAKQGKEPKQPCFLDNKGYLRSVNWKHWQNTQPNQEIIDAWFCNPKTGIGTLGGWNGKHWLGWADFDLKDFTTAEECNNEIGQWMEQYPIAKTAPMFRTPSGGYRFLFAFEQEPEKFKANSGFSLKPDGSHHCGELLCKNGGHTLLPPTVGLNGIAYRWVQWSEYPPVVDSPESIGLYPLLKKTSVKSVGQSKPLTSNHQVQGSLTTILETEIYPRLDLQQAFNWTGHDFQIHQDKLKGNCPWHDSQSGTAFYCERKGNSLLWRCPACDIGGSVIEYRHRLRGGNGSPRGRDFVELVQELADETGVSLPQYTPVSNHKKTMMNSLASGENLDEKLRLSLLALLKETDPIKRLRKRSEICSFFRISKADVELALKELSRRTQRQQTKVYTLTELLALESEGLQWLIPELLPKGETIILAGSPKAGKTLLAIDAAFAIATGESSFLGETTPRGKVLLVSCDESLNSTRVKLLKRGFRESDTEFIRILPQWTIDNLELLEAQLEDFRPDVVIVDSLRRISHGSQISENSAEFADNIYTLKETIGRYGASGILIHHTSKNNEAMGVGKIRGSSAIAGAVWGTWQLEHIPKADPNNQKKLIIDPSDPRRVLSVFARDTEGQTLSIEFNPENNSWELATTTELNTSQMTYKERIINLLMANSHCEGLSGRQIMTLLNEEGNKSIYTELSRMVSRRLINCKPASGDKRINIYSLPLVVQISQQQGDSPSPTVCVSNADYSAETIDINGFDNSQQNSQQIVNNSQQVEIQNELLTISNPDTVSNSEIVNNINSTGGERVSPMVADHLEQPQYTEQTAQINHVESTVVVTDEIAIDISIGTRVKVHCPGSVRDGKEAVVCAFVCESGLRKALVNVEGVEKKYRRFECFVPGNDGMRLEVIN